MKCYTDAIYIFQKLRITCKLRKLKVNQCGKEEDMSFLELSTGLRFYGPLPSTKDRKYYGLLPGSVKKRIPFHSYKVAFDIIIRYCEGGLKLGGPRKEQFYKVKKGDKIVEMGAYMGYYTMYLAEKAGPEGQVIAIEPMPENLQYLRKNISYNRLNNVLLIEKGVWNKKEIHKFYQDSKDSQSASMVLKNHGNKEFYIEVDTLDHILKGCKSKDIDFMLIQLNGIEPEALEGLTVVRPANLAIAARYTTGGIKPVPRIESLLRERGYRFTVLKKNYIYACT